MRTCKTLALRFPSMAVVAFLGFILSSSAPCQFLAAHADDGTKAVGPMQITVGRLYGSDHVEMMKELARQYQTLHPEVRVSVVDSEDSQDLTTYEKTIGPFPDIFALAVHTCKRVHELPYCVRMGAIVPVEDLGKSDFISQSGHFQSLWHCIEYQGKHWGVPFYAESYGLVVSRQFAPQDVYASQPATWEDLQTKLAASAKDDSTNPGQKVCGLGLISGEELAGFWFLAGRAFGEPFAGAPKLAIAKSEGLKQAFTFLHGMAQKNLLEINPAYDYAYTLVQNWQFNDNIHRSTDYPRQYWSRTTEYRVVPVPPLAAGSRPMPILNLYLAVKKSSPEKEAASWAFIQWVTSADVQAKEAVEKRGFLPIHDSVASSPMFRALVSKMPHLDVFVNTLENIEPVFPFAEDGDKSFGVLAETFLKAFAGDTTIDNALADAQKTIDSMASTNTGK